MRTILKNRRGFTLTELIIVMVIFLVVIMISSAAFNTVINRSSQQSKSVETQIEGIVGLEVLRADLEQAGFGLPWTFQTAITYGEATASTAVLPATFWPTGVSPAYFNDAGAPGNAPRAILSGTTTFNKDSANIGSSYLVIKSTLAAANDTSKKWTTVSFDKDSVKSVRRWDAADRDFSSTERVIVVKDSLMTTPPTRQLMASAGTVFSAPYDNYSTLSLPHQNGDTFEVYGVSPGTNPATIPPTLLRMPFNRADYYVQRPASNMPAGCANNTGILYKSTVSHSDGSLIAGMPLLDCVADMQVVYGLDTSGAGFVNDHRTASLTTAAEIRNQLKEIRVYILAQEGRKDLSYSYPSTTVNVGESFDGGTTVMGRQFNLQTLIGSDYKYYRWRVYTIVVRPRNLIQ